VRRIEGRGTIETAHRAKQNISQILRYAIAEGVEVIDPCAALTAALKPMPADKHHAAELDPVKIGEILRMIDGYSGNPITRALLKISPYVFQRPGEVRNMKWGHIDLEKREWRFNASKTGQEHIVPLSCQVIEILEDLMPLTSKMSEFVFPGMRSVKRPLSETALKAAFERMGINTSDQLTSHGWRAVARTHLDETLGFRPEVIEMQLAHAVKDSLGRAYNRTQYIEKRREMMQKWGDYLDGLRQAI
jgi:integrase